MLQILKNRFCGDVGKVPLEFDKDSLRFNQQTFPLDQTGNDDNVKSWGKINILG